MGRPDQAQALMRHFTPRIERAILATAVDLGQAVDDSRVDRPGRPQMTVDRLPLTEHAAMVERASRPSSARPPDGAPAPSNTI